MTNTKNSEFIPVYNANNQNNLISDNMNDITKLTLSSYITWRLQVRALHEAYELHLFITEVDQTPTPTITTDGRAQPNPAHAPWKRQDRMLYSSLIGTLTLTVQPLVDRAITTREVWILLANTYGKLSRGHINQLKQQLKHNLKGSQSIVDYMSGIITKADQLALLGASLEHENLLDIIIDGLGEYRAVIEMVNGCDVPISIEELQLKTNWQ